MQLTAFANWLNTAFAGYDRAILSFLHKLAELIGVVLTPLMKLITLLGEKGLILILLALVLMLFSRTRKLGICMFGAIACGAILTNFILKDWVARPRPFETLELYRNWWRFVGSPAEDGASFPSGHVTAATAGLAALCLVRGRRWILPSAIWVLLMAVSRNYLMAHYPSDVLFGVWVGLIAAVIAYAITRLIYRLLEEHADLPLCELLLNFDLPLPAALPRFFRRAPREDAGEAAPEAGKAPGTEEAPEAEGTPEDEKKPERRAAARSVKLPVPPVRTKSEYEGKHLKK